MNTTARPRSNRMLDRPHHRFGGPKGLTLIEIMLGMSILAVGLLAIAGMFSTAYTDVSAGGKTTMAVTAARQIIEDMRSLPFDSLAPLNSFDTGDFRTQPTTTGPELAMARKWRYLVAGPGTGWNFTSGETAAWSTLNTGGATFGGSAQVAVAIAGPGGILRQVTVTVTVPGRGTNVSLTTLITRL